MRAILKQLPLQHTHTFFQSNYEDTYDQTLPYFQLRCGYISKCIYLKSNVFYIGQNTSKYIDISSSSRKTIRAMEFWSQNTRLEPRMLFSESSYHWDCVEGKIRGSIMYNYVYSIRYSQYNIIWYNEYILKCFGLDSNPNFDL